MPRKLRIEYPGARVSNCSSHFLGLEEANPKVENSKIWKGDISLAMPKAFRRS